MLTAVNPLRDPSTTGASYRRDNTGHDRDATLEARGFASGWPRWLPGKESEKSDAIRNGYQAAVPRIGPAVDAIVV